jgi:hypothetical protein
VNGLTWRPAGTPDVADIADILADVARATPVGIDASATDVRARLSRPRLDADLDTRLAVDAAGRPVAYAEAADMGVGQDTCRVRLTSAVRPGALLPDQQTWPQHAVGLASFLPDASFLALTGDDSYQRAGFRHARLQVRSDNTGAVRLYTTLGFADSGRGFALMYGSLP